MRNNGVRTAENVNTFARDRDSLAQQYEPLARALRENANITLESLTGVQIVQSLEGSGYNFHFPVTKRMACDFVCRVYEIREQHDAFIMHTLLGEGPL